MKEMPSVAPPPVSVKDRIANNEALLLSFIAENTLPFTLAPKLIELTRSLSEDSQSLSKLSMSRTTASYKMKYG